MKKQVTKQIGVLGEYKSIWEGVDDELSRDLISQELRKNHRRSMKKIRRIASIRYWMQIGKWILEDMRLYLPLVGLFLLGTYLIIFIASR